MAFLLIFAVGPALADGHHPLARWMLAGNPVNYLGGNMPTFALKLLPAEHRRRGPCSAGPARPVRLSDACGRGNRGSGVPMSDPVADDTDPI